MIPKAVPELGYLENGVRIATYAMPWMRGVAAGIWATVGGRHEGARENGLSHFVEHMLFKGTARRTAERITSDVEGIGGDINAFTGEDLTCYHARAKGEDLDRIADVLCDMYVGSRFATEEIEREREVIREEILMVKDQPQQMAQEALSAVMWPRHGLGRPLTGTLESVGRFGKSDFKRFVGTRYSGRTTVVTVAGGATHAETMAAFAGRLKRLPRGVQPRSAKVGAGRPPGIVKVIRQPNEQVQIAIGYHIHGRHDRRRAAGRLLSVVLGEPMCSRLFQELRERQGLCYSVNTSVASFEETGVFSVSAGCEAGRVEKALGLIGREIGRVGAKGVSGRELRRAKDYALGQAVLGMESASSRMHWLGESLAWFGKFVMPEDFEREIEAVTAEELRRYASEYLGTGAAVVAVGPLDEGVPLSGWLGNVRENPP